MQIQVIRKTLLQMKNLAFAFSLGILRTLAIFGTAPHAENQPIQVLVGGFFGKSELITSKFYVSGVQRRGE